MPWMGVEEIKEINHVQQIRKDIIHSGGTLMPVPNIQAMNFMAHYYARNMERLGKYEAMQREHFCDLLLEDDKLTIGKAEAISKGSDFGKRRVYYEHLTAGYLEIINTLKKTQEFHAQQIKNQH